MIRMATVFDKTGNKNSVTNIVSSQFKGCTQITFISIKHNNDVVMAGITNTYITTFTSDMNVFTTRTPEPKDLPFIHFHVSHHTVTT